MLERLIAVDPGPKMSAYVLFDQQFKATVAHHVANDDLLTTLRHDHGLHTMVIESIESYGMAVGMEVFDTVFWSGRFAEAFQCNNNGGFAKVERFPRREVKLTLCYSPRATDSNIRQRLIDIYGGETAIGTKKSPGPLYGFKSHLWAALGLGVAYQIKRMGRVV